MLRIVLQTWLSAIFLLIGTSACLAFTAECLHDPNECTNGELCVWAIDLKTKQWDRKYPRHVGEAKRRGLYFKSIIRGTPDYPSCSFKQTPIVRKPSLLRTTFLGLSKNQRKKIQLTLKRLRFYDSSIDGLYGRGTAAALTAYNKQNLAGADLKKSENVKTLMNSVLAMTPKTTPEVVTPNQPKDTYKVASGTGFYVSSQGHIITNHHVIDGCKDMKVHSKGKVIETIKIADDIRNDLALLKIEETPSHVFALSQESPFPLQDIIVAGYPFGERVSSTLKFTQGIVSSIAGLSNDYSQIQIDAALQPGNSGGPIMDEFGNIVAVAVAKLNLKKILKDYGVVPENTNFGVKSSAVKNLMEGNGVPFKTPNTEVISKQDLSRIAMGGTVYLTCWMTTAQIEQMRTTKVLFEDLY